MASLSRLVPELKAISLQWTPVRLMLIAAAALSGSTAVLWDVFLGAPGSGFGPYQYGLLAISCLLLILVPIVDSPRRLVDIYTTCSLMAVNTFILLVALNLAAMCFLKWKERFSDPIGDRYGGDALAQVYPDMSVEERNDLLHETWHRPFVFEPFIQFRERPYRGDHVNVHHAGLSPEGVAEHFSTTPTLFLYGATKVASEQLALEYGAVSSYPVWINRCGVMAGAGQFGHAAQGIFAYWIHSFCECQPLRCIGFGGNGYQVRDCLQPRDLLPLWRQQIAEPEITVKPRVVNVSGGIDNSMSLGQLTRWCADRFPDSETPNHQYSALGNSETVETRPFDIPWMVLDSRVCRDVWDWQLQTPIASVLEEIAKHAESHRNWLAVSR